MHHPEGGIGLDPAGYGIGGGGGDGPAAPEARGGNVIDVDGRSEAAGLECDAGVPDVVQVGQLGHHLPIRRGVIVGMFGWRPRRDGRG